MIDLETPFMLQNTATPVGGGQATATHPVGSNTDSHAQFEASVIEVFHSIHRAQDGADWTGPIVASIKRAERLAAAQRLKGCVYALSLSASALTKQARDLDGHTHAVLLQWADALSNISSGQMSLEDAPSVLTILCDLTWFAAIPDSFKELIGSRLSDDARAQRAARDLRPLPLLPTEHPEVNAVIAVVDTVKVITLDAQDETFAPEFAAQDLVSSTHEAVLESESAFADDSSFAASSASDVDSLEFPVIDPTPATAAADEYVLLAEAFEQLDESLAGDLLSLPELAEVGARDAWLPVVETARDQFTVARNAAEYMGVQSLMVSLAQWEHNLTALLNAPTALDEMHRSALLLTSSAWNEYFQRPTLDSALGAIAVLEDVCWIHPLTSVQISELSNALAKVSLVASRQVEQRSETFDPQDLSLEIPADADWSVVEILLQELPELSGQFTQHISRVNRGEPGAIDAAQRVAHSLKGSGNTVGIRGVANLTHQLEDMLILIARDNVQVKGALALFLSEAADCLEEMSEAVAGVGQAPESAIDVYGRAIFWTNQLVSGDVDLSDEMIIDVDLPQAAAHHDVPEVVAPTQSQFAATAAAVKPAQIATPIAAALVLSTVPIMAAPKPMVPLQARIEPTKAAQDDTSSAASEVGESEAESFVRVPVSLIDRLLAMVGESSVLLAKAQNEVQAIGLTQRSVGDTASRLEELSADLERMVDSRGGFLRGKNRKADGFDELELDEYNEMHTMARRFSEMGSDNRVLDEQLRLNVGELANVSGEMERMQSELRDLTLQTRMVPVQSIASRLQRSVRQSARLTGKTVELNIVGGETLVDNDMIAKLVDPLMHVMRNAVDHGIEGTIERVAAGKPQQGNIQVSFQRERGALIVRCQDDGAGLDVARIRQKAIDRGLIKSTDHLDENAIVGLILQPGFSTRDTTNQMSGRGIGLDVVAQLVRDLKGELSVQHAQGLGTSFLLSLPLNLSSIPVMVAKTDDFAMAIALRGIEQIVAARDLEETPEGTILVVQDQRVKALWLEDLVGIPRARDTSRDRVGLLMNTRDGELLAVLTPELSQARNVLVKPLSVYVAKMRGIEGAAALGDGSAAPICDLPELLVHFQTRGRVVTGAAATSNVPRCLVVDDSVSVRRAMEAFVKDLGFEVDSARDGMEALAMIEKRTPALMIVDFEMPRMNGVELTRNVRQNAALVNVPIIMITSRSADKHRALAIEAGVNHYMTKPYTEDDLSEQVYRLHGAANLAQKH